MNNKDIPAYPVFCTNSDKQLYGLTKLEAFTMAALQGILAQPVAFDWCPETRAEYAVRAAEAALAELEKRNG